MNILVIDGQGGRIGKEVIERIKAENLSCSITAVGTNTLATSAMLKGGADQAATGENAVVVNARSADLIIGPIAIVIADSLLGEITPKMAVAVGQSPAKRILIPVGLCNNTVAGVPDFSVKALLGSVVEQVKNFLAS
ncbi:MAG: DUF3842 family protein [Clostridia bacterium]|nr:DUF3842 family protein [Clostridia bacterium]